MAAALLDVDGTLIDTSYHHTLAWQRAFHAHGIVLPAWRIHRQVGMGGDQLVPALVPGIEDDLHGAVEETRGDRYAELIDEVQAFDQAHELIGDLKARGLTVVLASSSPQDELDHYLDLLDGRELLDAWTTKDDVEATKPEPDLVLAALEKAGTREAVLVGDTGWDVEAELLERLPNLRVVANHGAAYDLVDVDACRSRAVVVTNTPGVTSVATADLTLG